MALKVGIKFDGPIPVVEVREEIRYGSVYLYREAAIGINRQSTRGTVVDRFGFPVGAVGDVFFKDAKVERELEDIYTEYLEAVEALQKKWDAARAKLVPLTEETR